MKFFFDPDVKFEDFKKEVRALYVSHKNYINSDANKINMIFFYHFNWNLLIYFNFVFLFMQHPDIT